MTAEISSSSVVRILPTLTCCLGLAACGLGTQNLRGQSPSLQACGGGPHCVSSFDPDPERHIAPIRYQGEAVEVQRRLLRVLSALQGAEIVITEPGYVHVEVSSRILRYVDDVEFLFVEQEQQINVRSSSRIGYYDFETNRDRIEWVRNKLGPKPESDPGLH